MQGGGGSGCVWGGGDVGRMGTKIPRETELSPATSQPPPDEETELGESTVLAQGHTPQAGGGVRI